MKMKMFFAAVAVLFTVGVATSCSGNKKAAASAEEVSAQTEQVQKCDSTKACCKGDSLACDSTKACCAEKAEGAAE